MTFLRGVCLLFYGFFLLGGGRRLKSLPGMTVYFSSLTAFLKKRATFPSIPFCRPTPVHWLVVRGTLARLPSTHGKHTGLHLLHSQPLVLRENRGARDHSCRSRVLIKGLTRGTSPLVGYLLLLIAG